MRMVGTSAGMAKTRFRLTVSNDQRIENDPSRIDRADTMKVVAAKINATQRVSEQENSIQQEAHKR